MPTYMMLLGAIAMPVLIAHYNNNRKDNKRFNKRRSLKKSTR